LLVCINYCLVMTMYASALVIFDAPRKSIADDDSVCVFHTRFVFRSTCVEFSNTNNKGNNNFEL
jgi:hypothetical protein